MSVSGCPRARDHARALACAMHVTRRPVRIEQSKQGRIIPCRSGCAAMVAYDSDEEVSEKDSTAIPSSTAPLATSWEMPEPEATAGAALLLTFLAAWASPLKTIVSLAAAASYGAARATDRVWRWLNGRAPVGSFEPVEVQGRAQQVCHTVPRPGQRLADAQTLSSVMQLGGHHKWRLLAAIATTFAVSATHMWQKPNGAPCLTGLLLECASSRTLAARCPARLLLVLNGRAATSVAARPRHSQPAARSSRRAATSWSTWQPLGWAAS
jgi:hypothetical protein